MKKEKSRVKAKSREFEIGTTEELLSLMEIYLNEWMHRDSLLWKQVFRFFLAALIIIIFPFVRIWDITLLDYLPAWIFPFVGFFMSILFWIVGKGYAVRLKASGITYQNIIDMLPEAYRRIKINTISKDIFLSVRLADLLVFILFLVLLFLTFIVFMMYIFLW